MNAVIKSQTKSKTQSPSKSTGRSKDAVKQIAENRKARHDYMVEETFEAGLVLQGSEVKSMRAGDVNLKDAFVTIRNGEAFLSNAHVSVYRSSSYNNHEPERGRKLLLNRNELERIIKAIEVKGLTCVPLKLYFKGGWAKAEIAIVRGKKAADKRDTERSRDAQRELEQARRK